MHHYSQHGILFVFIFLSVILGSFVTQHPAVVALAVIMCGVYTIVGIRPRLNDILVVTVIFILFSPAFFKTYFSITPVFYFFSTIVVFFSAKILVLRCSASNLMNAFRIIFFLAIALISWIVVSNWGTKAPFEQIIPGSSTNGIPSYFIVLQIGLSLATFSATNRLPLLSTFLTFGVALLGVGRASIIVAGMIIVLTLMIKLLEKQVSTNQRQFRSIILVFSMLGFLFIFGEQFADLIIRYTKLSAGIVDHARAMMLDSYIDRLSPLSLVIGGDYSGTLIESTYKGNPHISFIRTHAFYGLLVTLIVLISPFLVFFSNKKLYVKFTFFSFISLAIIRAISEPIFFPTLLDFFYFLFFYMMYRYFPNSVRLREL